MESRLQIEAMERAVGIANDDVIATGTNGHSSREWLRRLIHLSFFIEGKFEDSCD